MAELYNLTGKTTDDLDSVLNCISVRHKELISSVAGVKSVLRDDILGVFENNKALINEGDNCTKTIHTIKEESMTAVNSFMHFNMTSFRDECGDMILGETSPTEKLYNNIKATLMYYLPAVFPHSNDLTSAIHSLVDEYKHYKDHFYKSKVVFGTYVTKCDVNSALADKITDNWGKIFDLRGNVLPIVSIGDTISTTACADAINKAVKITSQKLTNMIQDPNDYLKVRVQLGDKRCLKFKDATLEKLVVLHEDDIMFSGLSVTDFSEKKTCNDLKDLEDPDTHEKIYPDLKIVSSLPEVTISDIERKCMVEITDDSSSLMPGGV